MFLRTLKICEYPQHAVLTNFFILEDFCEPTLNRTCRASTVTIVGWNEAQGENERIVMQGFLLRSR